MCAQAQKVLLQKSISTSRKSSFFFHAVGIQNSLLSTIKQWNNKTIIIEDSVHRLINPREVKLLGNNHFIIDSWRKVIPLQGSALYTTKSFKASKQSNFYKTLPYQIYVIFLWFLMELFSLFNLDLTAQKLMQRGYDTIGDNLISAPLFPLFSFLHKYIDYQKVRTTKYTNMRLYDNYFKVHKLDKKVFFDVEFTEKDWIQMRGYPIGLQLKFADHILKKLRNKGFLARFELNDSPWSKKQKIMYLPINPEINVEDVIKLLNDSLYEGQKANIL